MIIVWVVINLCFFKDLNFEREFFKIKVNFCEFVEYCFEKIRGWYDLFKI